MVGSGRVGSNGRKDRAITQAVRMKRPSFGIGMAGFELRGGYTRTGWAPSLRSAPLPSENYMPIEVLTPRGGGSAARSSRLLVRRDMEWRATVTRSKLQRYRHADDGAGGNHVSFLKRAFGGCGYSVIFGRRPSTFQDLRPFIIKKRTSIINV